MSKQTFCLYCNLDCGGSKERGCFMYRIVKSSLIKKEYVIYNNTPYEVKI